MHTHLTFFCPTTIDSEYFNVTDTLLAESEWEISNFQHVSNYNPMLPFDINPDLLTVTKLEPNNFLNTDIKGPVVITDLLWYGLKSESRIKFFAGKDILITNLESKPAGTQYMDQWYGHTKNDWLDAEYLSNFKSVTYLIDNFHPELNDFHNINFVYNYLWTWRYLCTTHPKINRDGKKIKTHSQLSEDLDFDTHFVNMEKFYANWHNLEKDFTLPVGQLKTFRIDLVNKLLRKALYQKGFVGSFVDIPKSEILSLKDHFNKVLSEPIIYELFPDRIGPLPNDRDFNSSYEFNDFVINDYCFYNSRIELVVESVAEPTKLFREFGKSEGNGDIFPMAQLTEKTLKPILLCKPFLLNASNYCYDQLTEWGIDWYSDVFGDYRGKDFEETSNNICEILENISKYDPEVLKKIAYKNYQACYDFASVDISTQLYNKVFNQEL